jgi:hypothetical protein
MLWIFLWIGLMILTAILAAIADTTDHFDLSDFLWSAALPTVFVLGGVGVVFLNIYFDAHDRVPEDRYTTLYSMNDAIGTKGRFFIGSGTISSDPVYTYYWQDGNRFRLAWVSASNAYITYSDETPVLVHHGARQRYGNWLSIGADDWRVDPYGDPYEFKIPEGSILQQYSLDAQ